MKFALTSLTVCGFLCVAATAALAAEEVAAPSLASKYGQKQKPSAADGGLCTGFGPQTPRDIARSKGGNSRFFTLAPEAETMNLCNIHLHTQAEHKGPGFSLYAGAGKNGGWQCNGTDDLSAAELEVPRGPASMQGVKPGDTVEVHWFYSSCEIQPGPGLGSCSSASCANPQLRVESQVFLLVNDTDARDFNDYTHDGYQAAGLYQPKMLPERTGTPVEFAGSTTGPKYNEQICSPLQVTWSVRPKCAKLDINSLHAWAKRGNVFNENVAHGVRQIVTSPDLLAEIN